MIWLRLPNQNFVDPKNDLINDLENIKDDKFGNIELSI